jgi:hypothetical protein
LNRQETNSIIATHHESRRACAEPSAAQWLPARALNAEMIPDEIHPNCG